MNISINPSYFCNFRCSFCYLTEKQLSDKQCIPLHILEGKIKEVANRGPIEQIDVYGGEVGLLSRDYITEMLSMFRKYTSDINLITNMSVCPTSFLADDITLSVSFDFECREKSELVLRNISTTNKDIHILMLASADLIKKDVDEMIGVFNSLNNVKTVEVKPYSSNQANQHTITFRDYEEFVKCWIESDTPKEFTFTNEYQIQASLDSTRNAFSDDHVYITPKGKFAVLDFDLNDNEYFHEFEHMDFYDKWVDNEKVRVGKNSICSECKYLGNCLSEHLRDVKDINESCSGFRLLLDWYNERT